MNIAFWQDEDAPPKLTQREIEDMERAEKEAQQRRVKSYYDIYKLQNCIIKCQDDIATVIAMTIIVVASVLVVIFKVQGDLGLKLSSVRRSLKYT